MIRSEDQFREELDKAKTSYNEFMKMKHLFNDEHYGIVTKRVSAFFEGQQICQQHNARKKRVEGIFRRLDDIEQEVQYSIDHPESRVSDLADVEGSPESAVASAEVSIIRG